MEAQTTLIKQVDLTANPAPLGLVAFGMTTLLLNLHNSGLFPLGSMILAMGIFYGGMAQVIAGIMEWKKGNTFGTTAFTSYGFFWLTLVGLIVLPKMGLWDRPQGASMVAYFVLWGIFTGILFMATLRLGKPLQVVFATLTVLFLLLAIGDYTGNQTIQHIAGYEGLVCGASAIYAGMKQVLDEVYNK